MSIKEGPPLAALQEPVAETQPTTTEQTPKRGRGRPKGSPNRPRPTTAALRTQIIGALTFYNLAFAFMPAPYSADALDEPEIEALADALEAQAKSSPRFRKMLEAMVQVTGGANLAGILLIIGARRAARHGMFGLGSKEDMTLGALIGQTNMLSTATGNADGG